MRTRMYGGVGAGGSNAPGDPIVRGASFSIAPGAEVERIQVGFRWGDHWGFAEIHVRFTSPTDCSTVHEAQTAHPIPQSRAKIAGQAVAIPSTLSSSATRV